MIEIGVVFRARHAGCGNLKKHRHDSEPYSDKSSHTDNRLLITKNLNNR